MERRERLEILNKLQEERAFFMEAFVIHNIKIYTTIEQATVAALEAWASVHEKLHEINQRELDEVRSEGQDIN
jgi:hypothetical protein